MSCITEILKLKGDKEVLLPVGENGHPWIAVEGGGMYREYEYLIVLNKSGHRCGYVAIPPDHPANNVGDRTNTYNKDTELDYCALDIDCHGGLTFGGKHHGMKDLLTTKCEDNWIGFDCGHYYDEHDFECVKKYYGQDSYEVIMKYRITCGDRTVRRYGYVEKECKSIIDQLIDNKDNIVRRDKD